MKTIFSIVVLIAALMVVNAKPFDISAELSNLRYSLSEKVKAADKTKAAMAKIMVSAVMSTMAQDSGSLVTLMGLEDDDSKALARFQFFTRLYNKIRRSPLLNELVGVVRRRFCSSGGSNTTAMAKVMVNAVMSTMAQDSGSLVTLMGLDQDDDGEALARFQFFSKLYKKIRRSPLLSELVGVVRRRFCSNGSGTGKK